MAEHDPYAGQDASNPPDRPAHPDPSRGVEDMAAFERMHGVVGHTAAKHGLTHPDEIRRAEGQAQLDALEREEAGLKSASESTNESIANQAKADLKGMAAAKKHAKSLAEGDQEGSPDTAGAELAAAVQRGEASMTPAVDRRPLGDDAVQPAAVEPFDSDQNDN